VVDAGALPQLIAAMVAYAGSDAVQAAACVAMQRIAADSDLRRLLQTRCRSSSPLRSLRAHAGDARLQKSGAALANRLRSLAGVTELVEVDRHGASNGGRRGQGSKV
jgi:hypothetical protein